ncbi:MAG: hypothetical protein ACOYM7_08785 [Paludibacter sp.]
MIKAVHFEKSEKPLYTKFNIKKGNIQADYSISLFEETGRKELFYHKVNCDNVKHENIVHLPRELVMQGNCFVRCITDFKSLSKSNSMPYQISLEIYQGDRLLGELEQSGELSYREKCLMFFSDLIERR